MKHHPFLNSSTPPDMSFSSPGDLTVARCHLLTLQEGPGSAAGDSSVQLLIATKPLVASRTK
jgi:hypothetical protein